MNIRIHKSGFSGTVSAPPSKSAAHRAAICAALACHRKDAPNFASSVLSPIEATKDMLATIDAANALGAVCSLENGVLKVVGVKDVPKSAIIDCGESGSTLRFFLPIAAALGVSASFRGHGRLPQRPMDELVNVLSSHGVKISRDSSLDGEILSCSGRLEAGRFELSGKTSSQYVTGLLFALPLLQGDSEIALASPLESRAYVDMTVASLKRSGVLVTEAGNGYKIAGNQSYHALDRAIEGDFSSAAFWFAAAAIGGEITVTGLDLDSMQGDKRILQILSGTGAKVTYNALSEDGSSSVTVKRERLDAFEADVSQIPDLMPILSVVAAFCDGTSRLYNAGRLRLKESDRIREMAAGLSALGVSVREGSDELAVTGSKALTGGVLNSAGDHRIAMSLSIAAAFCGDSPELRGCECVDKSYPDFYGDFTRLGGKFDVL